MPLAPQQLYSFDDVNFAYAIRGDFDPRISQPQPPGYPLFVLETRALSVLGFRRAESNLIALAALGSIAALVLIVAAGDRLFGAPAGFVSALLLLTHPSFWYTGLTSAVRVQLAATSLAVALLCYRVWQGESRLANWSSLALGLGAGIRPELGPLLLPLWAVSLIRARIPRRKMLVSSALLAAAVLAWLIPTAYESGGLWSYVQTCVEYGRSSAGALTSPLFGASTGAWLAALSWLAVWLFCGGLAWPLVFVLGWTGGDRWGFGGSRTAFLALWFLPPLFFAALFHVGDPGHVQAMTPVVSLVAGGALTRAASRLTVDASAVRVVLLSQVPTAIAAVPGLIFLRQGWVWVGTILIATPVVCAVFGWLVRRAPGGDSAPRWLLTTLLLYPLLALQLFLFFFHPWYYKARDASLVEQVKEQSYAGLALTSFAAIRDTASLDDHVIQGIRGLTDGRENAVVLWNEGPTPWRKASYYLRDRPVVALEGGPNGALARYFRGNTIERQIEGRSSITIDLPAGARLVWLIRPSGPFLSSLGAAFPLIQEGPLYYHDLPSEHGAALVGSYRLRW